MPKRWFVYDPDRGALWGTLRPRTFQEAIEYRERELPDGVVLSDDDIRFMHKQLRASTRPISEKDARDIRWAPGGRRRPADVRVRTHLRRK